MTWVELQNSSVGTCSGQVRINDLSNVGSTWWAASSAGDVWSWRSNSAPGKCARGQGHVRAIAMSCPKVGWLGRLPDMLHESALAITEDGGQFWTDVQTPIGAPRAICAIAALPNHRAWAAGAFFEKDKLPGLLHFDGQHWYVVSLPEPTLSALTDVWFFESQDGRALRGVVAGGRGASRETVEPAIFFTTDGGNSWRAANLPSNIAAGRYCWKLHFIDTQVGFATLEATIAEGGAALLQTCNGGQDWQLLPIGGAQLSTLQGVAFASWNHDLGWVCPRHQGLLTTLNGGQSWCQSEFPCNVNRIRVVGETAIAAGNALYRYNETAT